MRYIVHTILANENVFKIYSTMFRTTSVARYSQYSPNISNQTAFDLNHQYLNYLLCYFWSRHLYYWNLINIYIKNEEYVGKKNAVAQNKQDFLGNCPRGKLPPNPNPNPNPNPSRSPNRGEVIFFGVNCPDTNLKVRIV